MRLPRELEQFLTDATRGALEVRVTPTRETDRLVGRLERAVSRLTEIIAFTGFLLSGVLLLISGWR